MLLCRVDSRGLVDFSPLYDAVHAWAPPPAGGNGDVADRAAAAAVAARVQDAVSATGPLQSYEVRVAIEESTGTRIKPVLPAELLALPQADRVRRLARELAELHRALEGGSLSLDRFRAALRGWGIEETPEATRLLQQAPVSFSALLRALQAEPPPRAAPPSPQQLADANASARRTHVPPAIPALSDDRRDARSVFPHRHGPAQSGLGVVDGGSVSAAARAYNPVTFSGDVRARDVGG